MRSKGNIVKLNPEETTQYPKRYQGQKLIVTHVATRYMPSADFFRQGQPDGYHPGYDDALNGEPLYDLRTEDGEDVPFSVYEWEIES